MANPGTAELKKFISTQVLNNGVKMSLDKMELFSVWRWRVDVFFLLLFSVLLFFASVWFALFLCF